MINTCSKCSSRNLMHQLKYKCQFYRFKEIKLIKTLSDSMSRTNYIAAVYYKNHKPRNLQNHFEINTLLIVLIAQNLNQ